MNSRKLACVLLALFACSPVTSAAQTAMQTVPLPELLEQIEAGSGQSELDAVRLYAMSPYDYGLDGLEVVAIAFASRDDAIIEAALVGLRRLVAKGTVSKWQVRNYFDKGQPLDVELLRLLGTASDRISLSSASAYYAVYGDSFQLEIAAVERFAMAGSDVARRDLVRVIAVDGLATSEARQLMTKIIQSHEATDATILAAQALASSDPPYLPALKHLVELAKTDEFFAKPSLVRSIGLYGESAEGYLDVLRWMRAEVNRQSQLPALERSRTLHNSSFSLQVLDEVIDRIEHNEEVES